MIYAVQLPGERKGAIEVPDGYSILGLPTAAARSSIKTSYGENFYLPRHLTHVVLTDSPVEGVLRTLPFRLTSIIRARLLGDSTEADITDMPIISKYVVPCVCPQKVNLLYVKVYTDKE